MRWYVAHAIVVVRAIGSKRRNVTVYENLYLISGGTAKAVRKKAERIALRECVADPSLTIDGLPAVMEFAGIRKIVAISNPIDRELDSDPPANGTELTYSELRVRQRDLPALISGNPVSVTYVD